MWSHLLCENDFEGREGLVAWPVDFCERAVHGHTSQAFLKAKENGKRVEHQLNHVFIIQISNFIFNND